MNLFCNDASRDIWNMKNKNFGAIMRGKWILVCAALVFVISLAYGGLHRSEPALRSDEKARETDIIYYYGQWDTHSANVDDFLKKNKIENSITLTKKEVWTNKDNSDDLNAKALQCGLGTQQVGVPLVYSDQKCYVGDVDVIQFLKQAAGIQ